MFFTREKNDTSNQKKVFLLLVIKSPNVHFTHNVLV